MHILILCTCCLSTLACATKAKTIADILHDAPVGTPIADIAARLDGVQFYDSEAGSNVYPFWTIRARAGATGIAIGAWAPTSVDTPLEHLETLKYVGHFIVSDGRWKRARWVYSDGLMFDHAQDLTAEGQSRPPF